MIEKELFDFISANAFLPVLAERATAEPSIFKNEAHCWNDYNNHGIKLHFSTKCYS